jgi:transaldolase
MTQALLEGREMKSDASTAVAEKVRKIVLSQPGEAFRPPAVPAQSLWVAMKRCGTSLWLDTGDMSEISIAWRREFTALTTNNTLLNKEVQKGIYDDLVGQVAAELKGQAPDEDLVVEIAFVLNARHGLRLARRFGAKVSVEMHTALAHDADRTVSYGLRYYAIAPESFYVKVPLTPAGILAARRLGEQGVPVNFTLGFSARQNWLIASLARPAFVNVFLGRLNAFIADHKLGSGKSIGEKATLASQRAVRELRAGLGIATQQIAASLRDGPQVGALAGVDVLTMPPKVAQQFERLNAAPGSLSSQVEQDPEIVLAPSVNAEELGIAALWDVPLDFKKAVREMLEQDLSHWSASTLCGFLADRGFADVLPAWSPADIKSVTADGKIPQYARWKDRLARGEVGLDALLTVSGLCSFAVDQQAMDDRIRSKL